MTTLRHDQLTAGQEDETAGIIETPRDRMQTRIMRRRTRGSGQHQRGETRGQTRGQSPSRTDTPA